MNSEIVFSETQRFKQWWLWLIILSVNGLILFGLYQQLVVGKQFGDKPMSNAGLIIISALVLLSSFSFFFLRLRTEIRKDGIYVRFFPFHLSFRYYSWDTISRSFVRQYNPILEYGGWGVRLGLGGKGKAFNVSGNMGLQLEFTNNKKLLIGTAKPEEMESVLMNLHRHTR